MAQAIGVDIGGTGIKAGLVDLDEGVLVSERMRIPTPVGAAPADVLGAVHAVLDALGLRGSELPLGVAFPSIIKGGKTLLAANIAPEWVGFEAERFFEEGLGRDIRFLNDADAAGIAESRYGAAVDAPGLTILTTLGTGIGSAFLHDGVLLPNVELGHLDYEGDRIEAWAAYSAMARESLSWEEWALRLQHFYDQVEKLFSPDLLVVGGGVSKHPEQFLPLLQTRAPMVTAVHRNSAGIIGAAAVAAD